MDIALFKILAEQQLVSEEEYKKVQLQKNHPLSVRADLFTLLYLGIILFTSAVAILIYKNIDTIGHQAMLLFIAAVCLICFVYCIKHSKGYQNGKIESPTIWFDYVLLFGCLLLLTFIAYGQYTYNIFGQSWGLAVFIPMVLLFITAYYFDHLGILSLAITNLAAWAGISITPLTILKRNDFRDTYLMYTGLVLGIVLLAASFFSNHKNIKAHFAFTYKNFGSHILFISLLALLFYYDTIYLFWAVILGGISFLFFKNAIKSHSFYFLVVTILYAYLGFSYCVIKLLFQADVAGIYLGFIYFIASGIALIRLFIAYNKKIKKNAGLPQR